LQTRRLAESFEDLDISLAQSTGELWSCKWHEIGTPMRISKYDILLHQLQMCSASILITKGLTLKTFL